MLDDEGNVVRDDLVAVAIGLPCSAQNFADGGYLLVPGSKLVVDEGGPVGRLEPEDS